MDILINNLNKSFLIYGRCKNYSFTTLIMQFITIKKIKKINLMSSKFDKNYMEEKTNYLYFFLLIILYMYFIYSFSSNLINLY